MASLKKAIAKVVSHTRSSSKSSSRTAVNGDAHPPANGHAEKALKHATFEDTNASGKTAAQKQQEATNGLKRPSSVVDDRRLSFTEQKEERREEREVKDEEETRLRKERMKKAHEEVCF